MFGISPSPRATSAEAKSAWSNMKPATITIPPRRNVRNISGTTSRSYSATPRRLTPTAAHRIPREIASRTGPRSSDLATSCHDAAIAMSRRNGTSTYDTTPIATHKANHCENEATNPRYGLSPRLAKTYVPPARGIAEASTA